jgi:hypothetical protein
MSEISGLTVGFVIPPGTSNLVFKNNVFITLATPVPRIPAMVINLRGPHPEKPWRFLNALSRAYRHVRRDVWDARESRLRAKWESYG